jgi:hypothetical protein
VIYTNGMGHKAFIFKNIQGKRFGSVGKNDINVDICEFVYWIGLSQNTV